MPEANRSHSPLPRTVFFVPDNGRVVSHSELIELLEEFGSVGLVAQHLGVDSSTVSRHLTSAGVPTVERFSRRMGETIDRLQAEGARDRERIRVLERELRDQTQ